MRFTICFTSSFFSGSAAAVKSREHSITGKKIVQVSPYHLFSSSSTRMTEISSPTYYVQIV